MDLTDSCSTQGHESKVPNVAVSWEIYKRQQARISRRRLYPVTIFYTAYAVIISVLAFRSSHTGIAFLFLLAAVPVWTLVEFLFHRYILHSRFGPGEGFIRKFAHERLDPLHWEHHERPFDGLHINGALGDLIGLFVIAAPLSFIAPIYTLPTLLAGVVECYVIEEWVHHSVHFYDFRDPYFRYMKRHHGFHHAPAGTELGYGLTNGFWDVVFNTDYPEAVKRVLYGTRWSLSPWREKQKPLHNLDCYIVPALLAAMRSNGLPTAEAIDLLLESPKSGQIAAGFGDRRKVISQAITRLKKYGFVAIRDGWLTVPTEGRIRAYVSA
jgi:dihydroceramide fatty acyl 2-hydroxylase